MHLRPFDIYITLGFKDLRMLTSCAPVIRKKGAQALCLPNPVLKGCALLFLLPEKAAMWCHFTAPDEEILYVPSFSCLLNLERKQRDTHHSLHYAKTCNQMEGAEENMSVTCRILHRIESVRDLMQALPPLAEWTAPQSGFQLKINTLA